MTDAQRRGVEWREAVLRKLDSELAAKGYHGHVVIDIELRGGAIVGIEKTFKEKALRPEPSAVKAN